MSSAVRGVQGIICASCPKAFYVHCNAHILNLAIIKACSLLVIRNMACNITVTTNFFNYSPKRQRLLERFIEVNQPDVRKQKLRDLCRTRWIQCLEAYKAFMELYPSTVEALDVMLHEHAKREKCSEWNWNRETLSRANGLSHVLCSFEFLVALVCASNALVYVKLLSVKLQRKSNDIVKAYGLVESIIEDLEVVRSSEEIMDGWYQQSVSLADTVGTEPKVPRTASRQQHRDNFRYGSPKEYYRRSVVVPFLDYPMSEPKTRLGET